VKLAFDFARARAQALASQTEQSAGRSQAISPYQRLIDSAIKADQQGKVFATGTGRISSATAHCHRQEAHYFACSNFRNRRRAAAVPDSP